MNNVGNFHATVSEKETYSKEEKMFGILLCSYVLICKTV